MKWFNSFSRKQGSDTIKEFVKLQNKVLLQEDYNQT